MKTHEQKMSDACDEAMKLTKRDCKLLGIEWQRFDEDGNSYYTEKAQDIFNNYYDDLI